jgi:hypothetical protein
VPTLDIVQLIGPASGSGEEVENVIKSYIYRRTDDGRLEKLTSQLSARVNLLKKGMGKLYVIKFYYTCYLHKCHVFVFILY